MYKKQELKADNLNLKTQKAKEKADDYYLNKHILSGFPKYQVNGMNLQFLMHDKTLAETQEDYNDFIRSCPDTSLTNQLRRAYDKLLPFEAGKNIRESGLKIADSLHLVKGSDRKYILLFLSTREQGLPAQAFKMHSISRNASNRKGWLPSYNSNISKFQSNNAKPGKAF